MDPISLTATRSICRPDLENRDLSSLRRVMAGGATVPPELVRQVESRLNVRFAIGYGQTEASPFITHTHIEDDAVDRAETVGRPLPQADVKIVDPATGAVADLGTVGEICTRGYLVMHGYFENSEAIDAEGWLQTGDLAINSWRPQSIAREPAVCSDHPRVPARLNSTR
jgi:fatty-acyl-CoA synthase